MNSHLYYNMRILIFYLFLIQALFVSAQQYRGGELFQIKNSDIFWAAVMTEYFREYVAKQEEDFWCWAACVQMVLNY